MTTTKQSWLKRSLAMLLAVMMVMSMGVTNAFAADSGSEESNVPVISLGKSSQTSTKVNDVKDGESVAWVQKNYIKVSAMDGASEYYYYASLTAQESITAEKIKSEGQKIEPDTFAELEVKPGYSGGTIYLYAVAVKGNSFSEIAESTYVLNEVSITAKAPTTEYSVYIAGDTATVSFSAVSEAVELAISPSYYYSIDGGERIALDKDAMTVTVSSEEAATKTVTFYIVPKDGDDFTETATLEIPFLAAAEDITVTDNDKSESKSFPSKYIVEIDTYLTKNGIKNATVTLNEDIPAEDFTSPLVVPVDTTFILDLNGHKLETTAAASAIQYQGKGVELTIQDSSSGKTGLISAARAVVGGASSYQVATVTDPTEINITAGTLKTSGSSYSVVDYSQRYVNVTITGGTFEGTTSAAFKGSNTSALEIDDCTVTTSGQIFNPASGKVTINGGSYTTSGSCVADAFTQGFINGGKFYCSNTDISSVFYTYEGSLSFSEGKYLAYNSEEKCWQLYDIPEAEDSGSLLVTPVGGVETQYSSVTAAFKALEENGGTIKLESDSSLKNGSALNIPKDKEITLDLNGHRLSLQPYDDTIRMIQVDGTLIIQDSAGKSGELAFSDTTNVGITLGMTGEFYLKSGTLSGCNTTMIMLGQMYSNGGITIEGGIVRPAMNGNGIAANLDYDLQLGAKVDISGGTIQVSGSGVALASRTIEVHIHGDAALTSDGNNAVSITMGKSEISGNAVISSENSSAVSYLSGGTHIISGNASIRQTGGETTDYAVYVGPTEAMTVTIEDNARIESATGYAVRNQNVSGRQAVVNINGGHYKYGALPFEDSKAVTYKTEDGNTYILNPTANASGNYTGYHSLVTRTSLNWSDTTTTPPTPKTYQDFEDLNYAIAAAEAALKNSEAYTTDTVQAVQTALESAKNTLTNENANQAEIDYFCLSLNEAVAGLRGTSEFDPSNMADGTYKVDISMYVTGTQNASMTSGAVDSTATLIVENGKATLQLSFHPTQVMSLWGHLTDLWIYKGLTAAENQSNAKNWNGDVSTRYDYMDDTTVLSYYTVAENNPSIPVPCAEGHAHTSECYPYVISMPLKYINTTNDRGNVYVLRVSVDKMTANGVGDQNVDMNVKWGTLTAVSLKPTLSLNAYELSMMVGEKETVTATLKGADGYAVTKWESSNPSVAAVDNGKITAKGEGTATITVTATKSGEADLTKTISVTVAPAGSEAVKAETTVNGSTETITVSGDFLTGVGSDNVEVNGDTVTIDAASAASGITSSKAIIPQETAEALLGKTVVVKTSAGSVTLDSALIAQISKVNGGVTLSISEASVPVGLGTFSSAYELTLEDKNGDTVEFGEGKATVTVTSEDAVSYAYCIANGSRTERVAVSASGDQVSFTVSHFSLWALSDREYETGGEAGTGFFLEDGNYYVDIDLWKSDSNEASMGNVAFKNNGKALITVKNGKITRVQIGTNPVDIDPYHSAIIKFELADGTAVSIDATGELTTVPANKNYTYIKLVSFNLPDSAQPDISDAITYVPVNFYVPDTPMDAAVGETLTARLRFTWSTATKTDDTSLKVDDTSAAGDSDITGEEIVDVNLTDEATGIKLETNSGILSDKAVLSVSKLTQGADYDIALKAMNGVEGSWSLYKITTLVEGVETAPLGSVLLYIPCGEDGLTLYRVNADGSKTLVKGEVQNGYYVVRTTSLGLFAMVGEVTGGGNSGQNQNGDTTIPQTGDSTNVLPFALLALASGGMIGVLFISRKRKTVK